MKFEFMLQSCFFLKLPFLKHPWTWGVSFNENSEISIWFLSAFFFQKSSLVSHLKFAVSLGELETIVQGADEDFLHSFMIPIYELAGHYNDDSVIDGDSEVAKFCFGEEVELFRKFHEVRIYCW